jgi:hypothetical protein
MPERAFHELGDLLTKALIVQDFELYRSIFTLPVRFAPKDGKAYVLSDEAALRDDFDLYVSIIRLHGVTDIYRQFLGYDAAEDGQMALRWTTHILVRGRRLADPFGTRMLVLQGEGGWQIAAIESSEGHLNWTLGQAKVSPEGKFELKTGEH